MTFEKAENAHNDINQWRAARDSGSTAPPDYKALWQTPTSNNRRRGAEEARPNVCMHPSMDLCQSAFAFMLRVVDLILLVLYLQIF